MKKYYYCYCPWRYSVDWQEKSVDINSHVAHTLHIEDVSGIRYALVSDTDMTPTYVVTFNYIISQIVIRIFVSVLCSVSVS